MELLEVLEDDIVGGGGWGFGGLFGDLLISGSAISKVPRYDH